MDSFTYRRGRDTVHPQTQFIQMGNAGQLLSQGLGSALIKIAGLGGFLGK